MFRERTQVWSMHTVIFLPPPPGELPSFPTPNICDLRFYWARRPSLYLIAFRWIFIFLDCLLTLWILVKFCHLQHPLAMQFTAELCGVEKINLFYILSQPPANYTWWSSVLVLTETGYDHPTFNSSVASYDFIDISYIPLISLFQAEDWRSARNL